MQEPSGQTKQTAEKPADQRVQSSLALHRAERPMTSSSELAELKQQLLGTIEATFRDLELLRCDLERAGADATATYPQSDKEYLHRFFLKLLGSDLTSEQKLLSLLTFVMLPPLVDSTCSTLHQE